MEFKVIPNNTPEDSIFWLTVIIIYFLVFSNQSADVNEPSRGSSDLFWKLPLQKI